MSGPYCESCKHYQPNYLGDQEFGECADITKIIFDRSGNRMNERPDVHIRYTCANHTLAKDENKS
jgi:hypothetical protein